MLIRTLNPKSDKEINLVASRMQKTLVDVLGKKEGEHYYSKDWLLDRVKYHMQLGEAASIFLSEEVFGQISGQAIVRIEKEDGEYYGYFSTIYVVDEYRRKGKAKLIIEAVMEWCHSKNLTKVTYNTAKNHVPIIRLFKGFGFRERLSEKNMVRLELSLK